MSKNNLCRYENCRKRPSFNFEGQTKGVYCSEHKETNMVDLKRKSCKHNGCRKSPSFNFEGQTKLLYCSEHKETNMIDLKHKSCKHNGCRKSPSFNFDGQTKLLYCSEHKETNMIDLKHKVCKHDGCRKLSSFNFEGQTEGLYCAEHKEPNMVNRKHKLCKHNGCRKSPSFNFEDQTKLLYCAEHKESIMVNLKHETCKTYLCTTIVTKKYEGYCMFCYTNIFPNRPVARNYKNKEQSVLNHIKTNFTEITLTSDRTVQDGCSRRRPDIYIDLGYQVVIVEIDENQHTEYNCSCENKRLMEISQDIDFRPLIFIRFNPDDYIQNRKKIYSCWGLNKNGLCVVKKNKRTEWEDRLLVLENQVRYWLEPDNRTEKTVEVIHLFYDN
jgi:hypothetical protein